GPVIGRAQQHPHQCDREREEQDDTGQPAARAQDRKQLRQAHTAFPLGLSLQNQKMLSRTTTTSPGCTGSDRRGSIVTFWPSGLVRVMRMRPMLPRLVMPPPAAMACCTVMPRSIL